jgi:hypothetical protein
VPTPTRTPDRSRRPCVVVEQPTEPLVATHSTDSPCRTLRLNQFIGQALVIPLTMTSDSSCRLASRRVTAPKSFFCVVGLLRTLEVVGGYQMLISFRGQMPNPIAADDVKNRRK